ncbi:MRG-domain-containing protein [Dunaliella salina]|uniref:MRG-domain-containing protein n=1 Tax=Dunaliella salina TaxID=3046 RepID=A0ABQ7GM07_DUNSA|nr:MRG-domain-containing protein [Dunaliella salina]|eukprot:KAF5835603.1 MRG-domain-containing protein [Dunaliella salina]
MHKPTLSLCRHRTNNNTCIHLPTLLLTNQHINTSTHTPTHQHTNTSTYTPTLALTPKQNTQPKSKKAAGGGARQPAAAATTSAVPMGVPVSILPTPSTGRAQRQAHPKQQPAAAAPTGAGPAVGLDIEVPPLLKKYLVEDFEQVAEGGKLVPLPRSPCVAELMDRYVAEARTGRTGSVDAEEEVAHGLMTYFDKALPVMLLYRNERDQAADALADGQMPRVLYGAEHLSRLMVKLPDIIPLGLLTDDQLATVATMVQDVMLWMADNTGSLFLPKDGYIKAEPEPMAE